MSTPSSLFEQSATVLCEASPGSIPLLILALRREKPGFLPIRVADRILASLAEKNRLGRDVLALFLDPSQTGISVLPLYGSEITISELKGLGVVSFSGLVEIDFSYSRNIARDPGFMDFIRTSADTLRTLKLAGIKEKIDFNKLTSFKNLHCLDISCTSATSSDIETICNALPNLQYLDISGTKVHMQPCLSAIRQLTGLKCLGLGGIPFNTDYRDTLKEWVAECFKPLTQLTHLDLSGFTTYGAGDDLKGIDIIDGILSATKSLTHLELSLAQAFMVPVLDLVNLLKTHHLYDQLLHLGMMDESHLHLDRKLAEQLRNDLSASLCTLPAHKTLFHSNYLHRPMVLLPEAMKLYREFTRYNSKPNDLAISEALTLLTQFACLATANEIVNLMADDIMLYTSIAFVSNQTTAKHLALKLLDTLTPLYSKAPNNESLQLLLFQAAFMAVQSQMMSRRTMLGLLDVMIGVLRSNHLESEFHGGPAWSAVQLLNLLILNLKDEQKVFLTKESSLFAFLFGGIKMFTNADVFTLIAEQYLCALWNLCDGVREPCAELANNVSLLLQFGVHFKSRSAAVMCVIGTVGNVAEFPGLRPALRTADTVRLIDRALDISERGGMIRMTASRLLCMLCLDEMWETPEGVPSRAEILAKMHRLLKETSLKPNSQRLISFTSLVPLLELVECEHTVSIRFFSVWRIACLCNAKPAVYCPMLKREAGLEAVVGVKVPDEFADDFDPAFRILKDRFATHGDVQGKKEDDQHLHAPSMPVLHDQGLMKYFGDDHGGGCHHDHDDIDFCSDDDDDYDDDDDDDC